MVHMHWIKKVREFWISPPHAVYRTCGYLRLAQEVAGESMQAAVDVVHLYHIYLYFMVVGFVLNCYEEKKKKEKREPNWVSICLRSSHIVTLWKDKFFLAMLFRLIFTVLYY